jgi:hypothetical protein
MDPDPDPTPDPTPFFFDFKDAKKNIFFSYFFLITCPQAHHRHSKKFSFGQHFELKSYFAGIVSVRSTHL